jgi:hypothetical protein
MNTTKYFVFRVQADDEYEDKATHVALPVNFQSAIAILRFLLFAFIARRLAPRLSEIRFSFDDLCWLKLMVDDESESVGIRSVSFVESSFCECDNFRGNEIEVVLNAWFRAQGFDARTETRYFSEDIDFFQAARAWIVETLHLALAKAYSANMNASAALARLLEAADKALYKEATSP